MESNNNSDALDQTTTTQVVNDSGYISNPFKVFVHALNALRSNNLGLLIRVLLLFIAYMIVYTLLLAAFNDNDAAEGLLSIVNIFIAGYLTAMFVRYAISTSRFERLDFTQLIQSANKIFLRMVGLLVLMGLIIATGFILLIIPGIIFLYWFALAPYVLVDQDLGVIESLKKSRELVKGKFWEIIGLWTAYLNLTIVFPVLISALLVPIAVFLPESLVGISIILSIPIILLLIVYFIVLPFLQYIAWAYRYSSAQVLTQMNQSKPTTDKYNYISVVVAALFFVAVLILITAIITKVLGSGFNFV